MIIAFISGFLLDFGWTVYMRAVAAGAAYRAAFASVVVGGLSVAGVLSVVRDGGSIVPYLAGLFCGTLLAIKVGR